jgi:Tfp pilus assembly protein PilO
MSIMTSLSKNIHFAIIIYSGYATYQKYVEIKTKVAQVRSQIQPIENKIVKKKKELNIAKQYEENLEVAKKRVKEIQSEIESARKQLPSESKGTEIMDNFVQSLRSINVQNPSLKPGKEEKGDFYFSNAYILNASGTWLQFLIFFENLSKEERIFNVESLSLTRVKGGQRGRFQFVDMSAKLTSYRYNTSFKEKSLGAIK